MKVSISKSKNTTIYYLSRSVRVGNKTTTKTVEKIGTYDEIKKICGDMDPLDWAKEYAAKHVKRIRFFMTFVHIMQAISFSRIFTIRLDLIRYVTLFLKNISLIMT